MHPLIGTSALVTVAQIDQICVCRAPLSCTGLPAPNGNVRFAQIEAQSRCVSRCIRQLSSDRRSGILLLATGDVATVACRARSTVLRVICPWRQCGCPVAVCPSDPTVRGAAHRPMAMRSGSFPALPWFSMLGDLLRRGRPRRCRPLTGGPQLRWGGCTGTRARR